VPRLANTAPASGPRRLPYNVIPIPRDRIPRARPLPPGSPVDARRTKPILTKIEVVNRVKSATIPNDPLERLMHFCCCEFASSIPNSSYQSAEDGQGTMLDVFRGVIFCHRRVAATRLVGLEHPSHAQQKSFCYNITVICSCPPLVLPQQSLYMQGLGRSRGEKSSKGGKSLRMDCPQQ